MCFTPVQWNAKGPNGLGGAVCNEWWGFVRSPQAGASRLFRYSPTQMPQLVTNWCSHPHR